MSDPLQDFFINPLLINGWFNTQPFELPLLQRLWSETPCNYGGNQND